MVKFTAAAAKDLTLPKISRMVFRTHAAASSNDAGGLSPVLKTTGHKADHPTASSSEVLKKWSYTSNTTYNLMTHQGTP